LTIVLDVAADVAAERRAMRGEMAQLYEQNEVQRALAAFYRDLAKHMPGDRITVVDASDSIETVSDRIWAVYERTFAS
jgi:thymidylate kinase